MDADNGRYRCEKCQRDFSDFKWRLILSVMWDICVLHLLCVCALCTLLLFDWLVAGQCCWCHITFCNAQVRSYACKVVRSIVITCTQTGLIVKRPFSYTSDQGWTDRAHFPIRSPDRSTINERWFDRNYICDLIVDRDRYVLVSAQISTQFAPSFA